MENIEMTDNLVEKPKKKQSKFWKITKKILIIIAIIIGSVVVIYGSWELFLEDYYDDYLKRKHEDLFYEKYNQLINSNNKDSIFDISKAIIISNERYYSEKVSLYDELFYFNEFKDTTRFDSIKIVALNNIKKLADQGDVYIQFELGEMYYYGNGVKRNRDKAIEWWKKAAAQGGSNTYYSKKSRWYILALEQNDADAQYNLGWYTQAYKTYEKLAKDGNAYAQNMLGVMYYNGEGVGQDKLEAAYWYKKAADQGYSYAQYNLGLMYYNGDYVVEREYYGKQLIKDAARQGHKVAQKFLIQRCENW